MSAGRVEFEWIGAIDDDRVGALARVLMDAMRAFPESYQSLDEARDEVRNFAREEWMLCVATIDGELAGWGGLIGHTEFAWELHPLCVDPVHQGAGVGRAIVGELERRAREGGAITMWLGTEDEVGSTSLFGVDLFPDVLSRLAGMTSGGTHAMGFYGRLGYVVTGVIPDASGPGRHDFIMSKRLG